ncbi:MAG: aminoacyl-tRNA hydrolase [Reyranella sp.]
MWLVAGLGNPGPEYEHTRHNIGFMVADELARRWGMSSWKTKFGGEVAQKAEAVVIKPQQYMNLSGPPVQQTAGFYKIEGGRIIVVHDEIDLPFGKLKVKVGGGHGGHNGLRSIIQQMGDLFLRVRCGVGKPNGGKDKVTGHVLGGFSKVEKEELPFLVGGAADAVELIINKGPTAAMNQVNTDKPRS